MILLALCLGFLTQGRAESEESAGMAGQIARMVSSEVRSAETRLGELAAELEKLPALRREGQGSRYGFHSGTISQEEEPQWVQLDLGRRCAIDTIVAMPVRIATIETAGAGYGFPLRFTIDVADDPEMTTATRVVDHTRADLKNPGDYPMVFPIKEATGRYVRFTSTKHVPSNEGCFWALEELMILSGNRNLSAGCAASASSQLELFPSWAVSRINDGLSALGMPVTVEPSPTNGYLSAPSDTTLTEKWLVVDLGREIEIDEVRLLPAGSENDVNPKGFPRMGSRAFPRSFRVEVATDAPFEEIRWQRVIAHEPLGYPWGNPVVMQGGGVSGRYLRIVATELWARDKTRHNFALAEIQIYAGNENVALGKPVEVKDKVDRPDSTRWAPRWVVDGFTSRHPLIEIPEYLKLVGQRAILEREQSERQAFRDRKVEQIGTGFSVGGGSLGAVALLGWGWMLMRQKALIRRDVARLREQIARDLHDDIASNLGGIVLLSELGSRHQSLEQGARDDFAAIRKAAEETAESMQDIVWLIEPESLSLQELIVNLRKAVEVILGNFEVRVVVEPADFRNRDLSLLFRRHVYFAFKETLHNVRRHAAATRVDVRIEIDSKRLTFTVRDDGVGFDPQSVSVAGHGLRNSRRRAEKLKGLCRLESKPGLGTIVTFEAPLKS